MFLIVKDDSQQLDPQVSGAGPEVGTLVTPSTRASPSQTAPGVPTSSRTPALDRYRDKQAARSRRRIPLLAGSRPTRKHPSPSVYSMRRHLLPLVFLPGKQMLSLGLVAERLTTPIDVKRSIEYRSAQWVAENLPQQRVMMGGSMGNFLNTFTSMEQLSAQPCTTAPNWEEQIAVYTIYIGQNSADRDGDFALLWLKAFGVQAVAVSGPNIPEYWKPFANPRKFEGMIRGDSCGQRRGRRYAAADWNEGGDLWKPSWPPETAGTR